MLKQVDNLKTLPSRHVASQSPTTLSWSVCGVKIEDVSKPGPKKREREREIRDLVKDPMDHNPYLCFNVYLETKGDRSPQPKAHSKEKNILMTMTKNSSRLVKG